MLNIMDYEAAADGVTVNTKAIQRAIDLCGKGDTVYVPKGTFIMGALYLDGFYGDAEFDADTPAEINDGTPKVDGIYFKNIDIKTVGGNAVYLCGLPERHFKNVFLENVKAHGRYGIKHKNIDNLKLINVDITSDEE